MRGRSQANGRGHGCHRIASSSKQAAGLSSSRTTFRKKAAAGEFTRYGATDRTYRYYAYDLLDWLMDQGRES